MALKTTVGLTQVQSLVMTQRLQQSIKLLEMSNTELHAFIKDEVEKNPFLDEVIPVQDEEPIGEVHRDIVQENEEQRKNTSGLKEIEGNRNNLKDKTWAGNGPLSHKDNEAKPDSGWDSLSLDKDIRHTHSLQEYLLQQFRLERHTAAEALIAAKLIDAIDDDGYLRTDIAELAKDLGTDESFVFPVLDRIQHLEPVGVGARSLAECFKIQLKEANRLDASMAALLENLDLLSRRDYRALEDRCGVGYDKLLEMIDELQRLDPSPGSSYEPPPVEIIIPDIIMRDVPEKDGSWHIDLNPETMPSIIVNGDYSTNLRTKLRDKADRQFITESLTSAKWLVKALEKRALTLLKVSSEIVRQQNSFFYKGIIGLSPMTLKDVAEEVTLHESTISRTVNGKYISTPMGVIELKSFFTAAISTNKGKSLSAAAVRQKIKSLIETETSNQVFADSDIVEKLRAEGIEIARRTVAKYRESLHIPSSAQRKRIKLVSGYKQ